MVKDREGGEVFWLTEPCLHVWSGFNNTASHAYDAFTHKSVVSTQFKEVLSWRTVHSTRFYAPGAAVNLEMNILSPILELQRDMEQQIQPKYAIFRIKPGKFVTFSIPNVEKKSGHNQATCYSTGNKIPNTTRLLFPVVQHRSISSYGYVHWNLECFEAPIL